MDNQKKGKRYKLVGFQGLKNKASFKGLRARLKVLLPEVLMSITLMT